MSDKITWLSLKMLNNLIFWITNIVYHFLSKHGENRKEFFIKIKLGIFGVFDGRNFDPNLLISKIQPKFTFVMEIISDFSIYRQFLIWRAPQGTFRYPRFLRPWVYPNEFSFYNINLIKVGRPCLVTKTNLPTSCCSASNSSTKRQRPGKH